MEIRVARVLTPIVNNPVPSIYFADLGGRQIRVQHTSPYFGNQDGFIGLPEQNSYILVVNPDRNEPNPEEWYYISTIVSKQMGEALAANPNPARPPSPITETTGRAGIPQKMGMIGPGNHKVLLYHDVDANNKNSGATIVTNAGKMIRMDDSPQLDNIVIVCGNTLTGNEVALELQETTPEGSSRSSYSAILRATGGITIQSAESNVNIRVENQGGEINIENDSLGPISRGGPTGGNINIRSTNGAINIVAGPDPLDVAPGIITVPTASVNIQAIGGPATSMTLHTDGVLKLSGGLGVEIVGGDNRIAPLITSNVSIQGALIGLNSGIL
jgi:hypothetical protein